MFTAGIIELFIGNFFSVLTPALTSMFLVFEQSSFDGPSLILQQHEGVPSQQSIASLKKKRKKKSMRREGCTDVGGGLLTALTAVRDGGLSEQEMT